MAARGTADGEAEGFPEEVSRVEAEGDFLAGVDFQAVVEAAGVEARAAVGEKDDMKDFLTVEQEQAVADAIRAAESQTSGEIRVAMTSRRVFYPERYARRLFAKLGMTSTRQRNGALIVLFTRRRRFVVLGDSGFDQFAGPDYWQGIATAMSALLHDDRKVEALNSAIRRLGETMAAHWPPEASNPDELPNAVHRD
jgi:uncharacterized membrane protein